MTYSRFIEGLKAGGSSNWTGKVLSDMAIHDAEGFAKVIASAKKALETKAAAAA